MQSIEIRNFGPELEPPPALQMKSGKGPKIFPNVWFLSSEGFIKNGNLI